MKMRIFLQLIRRDLEIFKRDYWGRAIDIIITFVSMVVVFGFFVPQMGSDASYGVFIMVGSIASFGIFNIIGQAGALITDIQGDKTISYLLVLPISSSIVFLYRVLSWAIQSLFITFPLYFFGKAIFWHGLPFENINWPWLVISLITINCFFGFFSLWLVSLLYKVVDLNRVYFRFINPLFIFGCYFFSNQSAFQLSSWVGYITLVDPFSYLMELSRACLIGQSGYLPIWFSFCMLWLFNLVFWFFAKNRMKKILDCL